ncbi:MAG: trimethylamine methyltransferase family protein, partial [Planctomycetota bacterium]
MDTATHKQPGLRASLYNPMTETDLKKVVDASFEVLEKAGMAVYSKRGREALKAAGAEVDESESIVKMPRSMVEDAIASNPSSITLHARGRDDYDAVLEKDRVHYGTGGTAIYVLDPDTG